MLIDLHNDVLWKLRSEGYAELMTQNSLAATDLVRLREGGVNAQVFVAFCDGRYRGAEAYALANRLFDQLDQLLLHCPDRIQRAKTAKEIRAIVADGKIAALAAVEGGHMINDDINNLIALHARGMVYLTLTWNNSTAWATSALDEVSGNLPAGKRGLSAQGKELIAVMNELGIIADLSHAGEKTFYDVMAASKKPVMATHSNAYRLAPHFRNLKDEQLQAIQQNGGLVGVNFYAGFVDVSFPETFATLVRKHADAADEFGGPENLLRNSVRRKSAFLAKLPSADVAAIRPSLDRLIDHIDYIADIAGIDHVAIGSDFDGAEVYVGSLDDVSCFPLLLARLAARGYSTTAIEKLTSGNALRVLAAQAETVTYPIR